MNIYLTNMMFCILLCLFLKKERCNHKHYMHDVFMLSLMADSSQFSPLNAFLKLPGPTIWFPLLLSLPPMQNMENIFLNIDPMEQQKSLKPLIL